MYIKVQCVYFNPLEIVNSTDACILKANKIIQNLFELNLLSEKEYDNTKQEHKVFVTSVCIEKNEDFDWINSLPRVCIVTTQLYQWAGAL